MIDELMAAGDGAELVQRLASQFEQAGLFFGHGTNNAFDEAAWLVAAAHQIDYADPAWSTRFDAVLSNPIAADRLHPIIATAQARIETRKPLAYLLGEAWFAGLKFEISEDTLVPRSPIGDLIVRRFSPWVDASRVSRVLDIGTGSGCIAIATAVALPAAQITATDISKPALELARRNAHQLGVSDRVSFFEADVFPVGLAPFDLIVSNPPYVDVQQMQARPDEYRHEPELGLAAGNDGLDVVRRLLAGALDHLTEDGVLVLEVGASDEALQRSYADVPFTWLVLDDDACGIAVIERAALAAHESVLRNLGN
ncbi:MAG: 50S ribosomal protein L3 N(5)-glutamine methyltransferase [Pseudomonadota bacterium]